MRRMVTLGLALSVLASACGLGAITVPGAACSASAGPFKAKLSRPYGLLIDRNCNLTISDADRSVVVQVSPKGDVTTLAGDPNAGASGDGGPATKAALSYPRGIAMDSQGNLYIGESRAVRRVTPSGIISTIAGSRDASDCPYATSMEGGPASAATLCPAALALDASGNLYVSDNNNSRVFRITPAGVITTYAGGGQGDGTSGPATAAQLFYPDGLAVDSAGNLYIADGNAYLVRRVDSRGNISTFAGGGSTEVTGTTTRAAAASIGNPQGLLLDAAGNLFVGTWTHVFRITPAGVIISIAGNSTDTGVGGDGGPAGAARFNTVDGLALDASGNLFLADTGNSELRRVGSDGKINLVG
ncbi:MAG: NHL domain-containing protein [Candidatus Dormibacteria bacterium]